MRAWIVLLMMVLLFTVSCVEQEKASRFTEINDLIEKEFAPDKRVAVYDIEIRSDGNSLRITGETDQKEALSRLKEELEPFNMIIEDEVVLLPDASTA